MSSIDQTTNDRLFGNRLFRVAYKIWRLLPRVLRWPVLQILMPRLAPRIDRPIPTAQPPLIVAGLHTTRTGMGVSARICYSHLTELGFPTRAINFSRAFNAHDDDCILPQGIRAPELGPGVMLLHINAPYIPYVLFRLGRAEIAGRRLIGYWHWELPKLPASWHRAQHFLHEVWAPTRFVADAISGALSLPVRIVSHPIAPATPAEGARARLGFGDETFVVYSMANFASGYSRKNIESAIAAFRRAFGDDPSACLLLKLGDLDMGGGLRSRIEKAIGAARNIRLIDRPLTAAQMRDLYSACDVALSLHRSEGFGLLMAEAMAYGRAVVATAWSGNMDFMDETCAALVPYQLVPVNDLQGLYHKSEGPWAEPDVAAAADWLQSLRRDPALRQRLAAAGQERVRQSLSLEAYGRAVREALAG